MWSSGVVVLTLSCATTHSVVKDAGPEGEADAGPNDASSERVLCDGPSSQIMFYATRLPSRPGAPGAEVKARNGNYVFLTQACEIHCYDSSGIAYVGELTALEAKAYLDSFSVTSLTTAADRYLAHGCDAHTDRFGYGSFHVEVSPTCGSGEQIPNWLQTAREALTTTIESCSQLGVPFIGDVRYVLIDVEEGLTTEREYERASGWPLDVSAMSVSVPDYGGAYDARAARQVASGESAAKLRELRRRFLLGEFSPPDVKFIPIEEADGSRYQLNVSDSLPLEDADGILPFGR